MARKTSRNTAIAVGVGIAAALAAIAIVLSVSVSNGGDDQLPPPLEMGPDTAGADPPGDSESLIQTAGLFGVASSSDPDTPDAPPVTATTTATGDITYEQPWLTFSATFPPDSQNDPVVARLRADAETLLNRRAAAAKEDFDRRKQEGHEPMGWEVQIAWSYTARAGNLSSLLGEAMEYTGGAHPITMFDSLIVRDGQPIRLEDLMIVKRSPSPAMSIALCEGLKAEKLERINEATIFGDPIVCAGGPASDWMEEGEFVLAPSTTPGRFGGVTAHFQPYAVGAYAEGPYAVTIQQAIFADDLRPDVRTLFDGEAK